MLIKDFIETTELHSDLKTLVSALDHGLNKKKFNVISAEISPCNENSSDVIIVAAVENSVGCAPIYLRLNTATKTVSFGQNKQCFSESISYKNITKLVFASAVAFTLKELFLGYANNDGYDNSLYQTIHFKKPKIYEGTNHITLRSALVELFEIIPKVKKTKLPARLESRSFADHALSINYNASTDTLLIKGAEQSDMKALIRTQLSSMGGNNETQVFID